MILNPFFGKFGGQFVPQALIPALDQLEAAFVDAQKDPAFAAELKKLLTTYAGRPTPITLCRNLTRGTKARLYLKREDLVHGGAHKTNQVLGQALLAKRMGKTRLVAETGAGQHGVATAIAGALMGFETHVYMGAKDVARQKPNVLRMQLMGAVAHPVTQGAGSLKEACSAALEDFARNYENTHYMLGTAAGPHPYPTIVREYQKIIGEEAKRQLLDVEGRLPDAVVACVGGGSNAIGVFTDFMKEKDVRLIGVEPGGLGVDTGKHGAPLGHGTEGVFFGARSYNMQTPDGQIIESYSISAGLDFPSVGPEHAYLKDIGRAQYVNATDEEALLAFRDLCLHEGILPALESSHALAYALRLIRENPDKELVILCNLSGRGDKDVNQVLERFERNGLFADGVLNREAYVNAVTL